MSNFEHWIREDSTEFEKAFLKIYDGNMWRAVEKMKDWQPPKELFKIPKLVADFIEHKRLIDIAKSSVPVNILDWLNEQTGHADFDICVSHLIRIKAVGYMVEKEQLYRVVLPEAINCYLNFRTNTGDAMFGSSEEIGDYKTRFTEQEIKALDERYWQFAVPVDEV